MTPSGASSGRPSSGARRRYRQNDVLGSMERALARLEILSRALAPFERNVEWPAHRR